MKRQNLHNTTQWIRQKIRNAQRCKSIRARRDAWANVWDELNYLSKQVDAAKEIREAHRKLTDIYI